MFILPSGETITKQIDMDTYRSGALEVDKLIPKIENLNVIGDLAVITLTVQLTGRSCGVPFEASYRYIMFWKKFTDGIKVVGGSGAAI